MTHCSQVVVLKETKVKRFAHQTQHNAVEIGAEVPKIGQHSPVDALGPNDLVAQLQVPHRVLGCFKMF